MNNKIKRKEIIDSIEQLNFEIGKIKKEIEKIEEKDAKIRARSKSGKYINKLYWKIPVKWIETVFYTRKDELKELACVSFAEEDKSCLSPFYFCTPGNNYTPHIAQVAALCEDVIETENGISLLLCDPHRKCKTLPLDVTASEAHKLIGNIIVIEGHINTDSIYKTDLDLGLVVYRYKGTAFNLKGCDGKTDEVTDPIAKLALELKDIKEEETAVQGVTAIQNYVRASFEHCKVYRLSPLEVRFVYKDNKGHVRLYGVKFENGEFWFMQDAQEHYFNSDVNVMELHMIQKNIFTEATVERSKKNNWAFHCIDEDVSDKIV